MTGKRFNKLREVEVYMKRKKVKLQNQFKSDQCDLSQVSLLFEGIAIYVAGFTIPSSDELKKLMMTHGGTFHHYQNKDTTHVISTHFKKPANCPNVPVVNPNWILECLKAQRLLDVGPFEIESFANPRTSFCPFLITKAKSKSSSSSDLKDYLSNSPSHLIYNIASLCKNMFEEAKIESRVTRDLSHLPNRYPSCFSQVFFHITLNSFFVSLSCLSRPGLSGYPVVLTVDSSIDNSKSVIACSSFEAKALGIQNGSLLKDALIKCPSLNILPLDFELIKEKAMSFYSLVLSYGLELTSVSSDELLLNVTKLNRESEALASELKQEIKNVFQILVTIGVGPNRLLARFANRNAKPNGIYILDSHEDISTKSLLDLSLQDCPEIDSKTTEKLKSLNYKFVSQLKDASCEFLMEEFGVKFGKKLYGMVRGQETDEESEMPETRQSISAENNGDITCTSTEEIHELLKDLSIQVSRKAVDLSLTGRSLTCKTVFRASNASKEILGTGNSESKSKSCILPFSTKDPDIIFQNAVRLMSKIIINFNVLIKDIVGIVIIMSKLESIPSNCKESSILRFMSKNPISFVPKVENAQNSSKESSSSHLKIKESQKSVESSSKGSSSSSSSSSFFHKDEAQERVQNPSEGSISDSHSNSLHELTSLSQIDESVFNSLPLDIQLEIKNEIQRHSSETSVEDPNITFSRIDPSILAQLPSEIYEEVKEAYSTKTSAFDKLMTRKNKKSLNAKNKKGAKSEKNEKKSNDFSKTNNKALNKSNKPRFEDEIPSLNDKTTLEDIRELLSNWMIHSNEPSFENIDSVLQYFKDLIAYKDLDKLILLLKFLKRTVSPYNETWKITVESLQENVQNEMLLFYDHTLNI